MNDASRVALSSIAMDLKRVALGYDRGSIKMADKFLEEAIIKKKNIDSSQVEPYLVKILQKIDKLKAMKGSRPIADNALLYSILIQNAAVV